MKQYNIQDILSIIIDKRVKFIMENDNFPNTMEIGTSLLMFIKMQYLYIINEPLENIKTMFGMNIILDSHIDEPEEIKIYYKESENKLIVVATDEEYKLAKKRFKHHIIIKTGVGGINVIRKLKHFKLWLCRK